MHHNLNHMHNNVTTAGKKKRAVTLLAGNQRQEASDLLEQVCQADPRDVEAWASLVQIYAQLGKASEVERCCHAIITILPNSEDAYYNLGCSLLLQSRLEEAATAFQKVLQLKPGHALANFNLGRVFHFLNRFDQALTHYKQTLRILPDFAEAHSAIGTLFGYQGQLDEAASHYRRAIRLKPKLIEAVIGLGVALTGLGNYDEAQEYAEQALRINPNNVDAIALAASIADYTGNAESAYALLAPVINASVNHVNIALTFANVSKAVGRQNEAIANMERILNSSDSLATANRLGLHFQLGKLYDAKGDYDKAFTHYQQGNALKPLSFDPRRHRLEIDALIGIYSPAFMAGMPRVSIRSDRPVFIVGMVRSGTSLVEQILASHPKVFGAGELPDMIQTAMSLHIVPGIEQHIPQSLHLQNQDKLNLLAQKYLDHLKRLSPDAVRVIDKAPLNFLCLGLIELLFPDARIIHCKRDPMDTCLSAYFQDFTRSHPYCYDLSNLGVFYREYRRLMQHWREVIKLPMLEVQYEELIADQETVSRRIIEFCDLDWDDRCLQFHKTKRYVTTASYDQVRQPLYKKSAGRWRNYERYLEPLSKTLQGN